MDETALTSAPSLPDHCSDLNADLEAIMDRLEEQIGAIATGLVPIGNWDAATGQFPKAAMLGTFYIVSGDGRVDGVDFAVGDWLIPLRSAASRTTFQGSWMHGKYARNTPQSYDTVRALLASRSEARGAGAEWRAGPYVFREHDPGATAGTDIAPMQTADGIVLRPLPVLGAVDIAMFGAQTGSDTPQDITGPLQCALDSGLEVIVPAGHYFVRKTIHFSKRNQTLRGTGCARIDFVNEVPGRAMFSIAGTVIGMEHLQNLVLVDDQPHTSVALHLHSDRSTGPIWKNRFSNLHLYRFGTGIRFEGGTKEDWTSESLFDHCKIINCAIGIDAANDQAYNTCFIETDFENYDEGGHDLTGDRWHITDHDGWPHILMRRGGGFHFFGGSIIGRGPFVSIRPDEGPRPMSGALVTTSGLRAEIRKGWAGPAWIYQDPTGNYEHPRHVSIDLTDLHLLGAGPEAFDLVGYAQSVMVSMKGVQCFNIQGHIRQYPIEGVSSRRAPGDGAYSLVVVDETCRNICYRHGGVHGEQTPWGKIDTRAAAPVILRGQMETVNGSNRVDEHGFVDCPQANSLGEIGRGLSLAEPRRLIFNTYDTVENTLFLAPYNGRPLQFGILKDPDDYASEAAYALYVVKDTSLWARPELSLETDAWRVGVTGSLANFAGSKSFDLQYGADAVELGQARAGLSLGFSERRMALVSRSPQARPMRGMFWVEFY